MNLRNKVNEHPIIFSVILFGSGFLFGVTMTIEFQVKPIEFALSEARLKANDSVKQQETLEEELAKVQHLLKSKDNKNSKLSTKVKSNLTSPINNKYSTGKKEKLIKDTFSKGNPMPSTYSSVKSDTRITTLKLLYPDGELSELYFSPNYETHYFSKALFVHDKDSTDPKISFIIFNFQNKKRKLEVKKELIEALGEADISKTMGEVLMWNNVNGFEVTFGDDYMLRVVDKNIK